MTRGRARAPGAVTGGSRSAGERGEGGFTLLEVLVALAIVGIAVVSLLELSSQGLRLVKNSGDYQSAALLADRLAADTDATDEVVDTGSDGPYQWERRVAKVPVPDELMPAQTAAATEPPKIFSVVIDVRWGRNQLLQLAALRTPTTPPPVPGVPSTGPQQTPTPAGQQPSTPGMPSASSTPSARTPASPFSAGSGSMSR